MIKRFLNELRHRRVLQSAVAYALVAAAAVEFTDIVSPALGLPDGLLRGVISVFLMGFPVVIVLAWFFDLSSGSIVRGTSSPESLHRRRSNVVSVLLIGLLGIAVVYLSYRLYWETHDQAGLERGKSVAVLPFASISSEAEPETAYFGDGVAEEIMSALSRVEGLRVAARTSSFAFRDYDVREVGEALNVSVVLQGTVRRAGDQLRISAQLVDTGNGFQLWSDVYDHELKDIFLIQEAIAQAIVKALKIELFGHSRAPLVSPGTVNTQAYDRYLAGRDLLKIRTPSAARKAISLFEEALEFDPKYAQAYAGLADSWILLREVGNLTLLEATQRSHEAISKSLQLNNALPEAQASLGLCILGGGDRDVAAIQFQKAIDLDSEYSNGHLLRANLLRDQGYLVEATRAYTQALALDPLNLEIHENQALLLAYQGRFDRAIEQLGDLEQRESGRLTTSLNASRVWALKGDNGKALVHARRAAEIAPGSPIALAALVESYARVGYLDEARAAHVQMLELAPNNETAIITTLLFYMMTGEYDVLDQLAASRGEFIIGNQNFRGTEILLERTAWAASAKLLLGDALGARELLENGIQDPAELDPNPTAVRALALLAKSRLLTGEPEGAAEVATGARQLVELAHAQGWGGAQFDYAMAGVEASVGSIDQALENLKNAIGNGWDDFIFASHDPVMMGIVQLPEYKELLDAASDE